MRKYDKKEKELEAKELAAKEASEVPAPELPVNYTPNDEDRDQKEFADADVDQSGKAIADELQQPVQDDTKIPVQTSKEDEIASDKDAEMPKDDTSETPPEEPPMPPEGAPTEEPPAPEAPTPGTPHYYSDLMNRFKAAQEQAYRNKKLSNASNFAMAAATSFQGKDTNPYLNEAMKNEYSQADLPVQQFEQQLQVDGQDPDSQAANSYRKALANSLGIDESKFAGMNFAQMEKVGTQFLGDRNKKLVNQVAMMNAATKQGQLAVGQQRADLYSKQIDNTHIDKMAALQAKLKIAANQTEKNAITRQMHMEDQDYRESKDLAADLDKPLVARSGVLGKISAVDTASQKLDQLFQQFPDGNIPKAQTHELALAVAGLIGNGTAQSQQQINNMVPHSYKGNMEAFLSDLTNNPRGLQQQKFIKQLQDTTTREGNLARQQLAQYKFSTLPGHERLRQRNPERFYNIAASKLNMSPEDIKQNYDPTKVFKSMNVATPFQTPQNNTKPTSIEAAPVKNSSAVPVDLDLNNATEQQVKDYVMTHGSDKNGK